MEQISYRSAFAKYASLNVLGMLGLSCYILADTYFVSLGLGADGLAALNLAIPVYNFIHGSGLMLGMGASIKYTVCRGQGDQQQADRLFTGAAQLALLLAALFLLAGLFLSGPITAALGADQAVFSMTHTYLRTLLLFSPAFLANDLLLCFVRNDGSPRLAMLAMLGSSFTNVVLDYLFIFPLGMGIFGAVLATGLSPLVSIGILARHWLRPERGFHLVPRAAGRRTAGTILSLGFPSLVAEVSSGVVIIVFNQLLLGLQGNVAVAAYGVVANLSLVVTAIFTGVAQGAQPLLSSAYGHGEEGALKGVLRCGICTVLVLACAIYGGILLLAEPIAGAFNSGHDPNLTALAVDGLRLYFLSAPFSGCNILLASSFAAVERAVPAQLISLLRGLVLVVPTAMLMAALLGITGVWLALPVTEILVAALALVLFRRFGPGRTPERPAAA